MPILVGHVWGNWPTEVTRVRSIPHRVYVYPFAKEGNRPVAAAWRVGMNIELITGVSRTVHAATACLLPFPKYLLLRE